MHHTSIDTLPSPLMMDAPTESGAWGCAGSVASDYHAIVSDRDGGYNVSHQDAFCNIGIYIKMLATMVGLSITQDWWLPSHLGVSAGDMESPFLDITLNLNVMVYHHRLGQLPH